MKIVCSSLFLLFLFQSCDTNDIHYKYHHGTFESTPVNFLEINSEYDDFNASAPILGETFPLVFSTNRTFDGNNFNIIYNLISIEFSRTYGTLNVFNNTNSNLDVFIENHNINLAINRINKPSNELGPYLFYLGRVSGSNNSNNRYNSFLLMYSSDVNGHHDIFFTENMDIENYSDPMPIQFLNSDYNDAYPCFNSDLSMIYFCSDRYNSFDIFKTETNYIDNITEVLVSDHAAPLIRDTLLSSPFNDKCPFIFNDLMVFASDRSGGFGGYDLYYSKFENAKWSVPQNFGNAINTEHDEYRPIVRAQPEFSNNFMLFSSNRPGGKGGFDLYYVGIEK